MTLGFKANIAPELRVFAVQLDSVTQHPMNSRKHRLDKLQQSLERHGQRALIVVQKSTRYIVKGNGTWAAAKALGWTQVAVMLQELTDDEALAFLYADNRASDLAGYDRDKHRAGLEQLVAGPGLLGSLWTEDEWADLDSMTTPAKPTIAPDPAAPPRPKPAASGIKDVRFPLTLADHATFVDGLERLQERYQTAGAIATILETVKRQVVAEAGAPVPTGRQLEPDQIASIQRHIIRDIRAVVDSMPGTKITKAQLYAVMDGITPAAAGGSAPDVVPGQLEAFPDLETPA